MGDIDQQKIAANQANGGVGMQRQPNPPPIEASPDNQRTAAEPTDRTVGENKQGTASRGIGRGRGIGRETGARVDINREGWEKN